MTTPAPEKAATPAAWNFPLSEERLTTIAQEACDNVLSEVTAYDHEQSALWSSSIISKCIEALKDGTAPPDEEKPEQEDVETKQEDNKNESKKAKPSLTYRFIVNCTIMEQHKNVTISGRRGMRHCAGAYWDAEKDGMWSYKYSSPEDKGLEVPMTVAWFATHTGR